MRTVRRLGVVSVLSVLGSALTAVAWPIVGAAAASPGEPRAETRPFVVGDERPPAESDETDPGWLSPSVTMPPATTVDVDVPASGWAAAGSLPVSVARPSSGVPVSRLRVRMLSQSEVAAAGGRLLGFELSRADGGAATGSVAVTLDYAGIAKAYGGDFASRLRLVRVADCGAGAPCLPPQAGAANDASARRLRSMRVSVAADPSVASGPSADSGMGPQPSDPDAGSLLGAPTMFTATSGASGPNGDFTASQLSSTDRWDVGVGSGGFTYSYPFALPPAPYGPTPSLSLDYSSQSVDGRNAAANGQAPTAGEGWSMEPGFIERRFHSCADEGLNQSDLCWSANNEYFLHFGGHSGELIRNGATNEWRLGGNDPAWRVLSFTGANNSDNDGEYFLLITPDGTKYWFGNGVEPGGTPAVTTGSTYEVPVFGGSGEPCYSAVAGANWCQQAYRWNVDRIEDTNSNVTTLFYAKEYNYYARAGTASLPTRYVRAGSLLRIEYGQRSFTEQDPAAARVLVTTTDRCAAQTSCPTPSASSATAYPDVPMELMCSATSCPAQNSAPTFWSTKEIATVATQYYDAATAGFDTASIYTMSYSFPATGDTTTPSLWLTGVTHTGYYGPDSIALPAMSLTGVNKQNRVITGTGVPALNKWRVASVNTELGARVDVTYGLPDPCPNTAVDWWVNPYDCYPAWYDPHDNVTTPGWVAFHKYVVTDVAVADLRGGQPTRSTHYTYNDTPAWHYEDSLLAAHQTWSEYRGYSDVRVTTAGDATSVGTDTRYLMFRGMYGDKLTSTTTRTTSLTDSTGATYNDYDSRAGLPLEVKTYDPTVGILGTTLHRYWAQLTVNGPNGVQSHDANFVREATTIDRTRNTTTNAWRDRERRMTYSVNTSMVLSTSDDATPGTTADDTCAKVAYVTNAATGSTPATTEWIVDAPTRTVTYSLACEATGGVELAKTEYYYDNQAFGAVPTHANPTMTAAFADAVSTPAYTKTGYDGTGRVTSRISPNEVAAGTNGATTVAYVPTARYPSDGVFTTNVLGQRTVAVSYFAFGTPRELTDVNGNVTSYTVDALGRVLSVSRPDDAAGTPSLTFAYVVGLGQTNRVTTNRLRSGTSYLTSYEFIDGLGRSVQTQERDANDGGTGPGRRLTTTSYDPFGRVAARTEPFGATGTPGQYLAVVDPAAVPLETRYKHDAAGRTYWTAQHAHDALSFATRTVYDGWNHTVDAPVRGDVDVTVDILGRTTAVTEQGLAAPVTTTYAYTRLGDLATITDAAANVTSYGYDWLRRRTSSTDPDQGQWLTTYDPSGNVATVRDAKLATVTNTYDRIGRRTATSVGGTALATWTYDTATVPNAKGRLVSASRVAGADTYTTAVTGYDTRGRVTGKSWTAPSSAGALAGTYTYGYTYDPMDNLASVTLPAAGGLPAETVTTVRNNAALPTRITTSLGADYVAATTYGLDGRVVQRTLPGVTRSYTYDTDAGRLATIQSTATGSGTPIEDLAYTWDDNNDVTSVTDALAGAGGVSQRECFTYDALSRLTAAFTTNATACAGAAPVTFGADPYNQTYTYNPVGDLTSLTNNGVTGAYTYGVTGHAHAAATIAGAAYAYDANGATTTRPTSAGAQTLAWNDLHQLTSVTGPGATTFVYDADGNRLLRTSGSTTTLYLDGMELSASSGTVTAARYYGDFAMRTPAGVSVLLHNHQGSTTTAVDTATGAVTRQRYTPFGARRGTIPLAATDRRFLGQAEDTTGLVATGARYYDPAAARFISIDPLTDLTHPQSLAGYSYARNNPTSLSDPSGLEPHQNSDGSWGGMGCAHNECNGSVEAAEDRRNTNLAVHAAQERTKREVGGILAQLDAMKARDRNEYWSAAARDCNGQYHGSLCEIYYRTDVVRSILSSTDDSGWLLTVATVALLLVPLIGEEVAIAAAATAVEREEAVVTEDASVGVSETLNALAEGKSANVWIAESETELKTLFEDLTTGGEQIEWTNYKGTAIERPDGTQIGIRPISSSGGATIDIRMPDGTTSRIHIR